MFSSFFSASDARAPNIHPVTNDRAPSDLFGELTKEDLEYVCAGGFSTETQIWYHMLEDGKFLMCQVIHSAVGLWYPTVQFTCRIYDPKTKQNTWRSTNVSGFVSPMPGSDDKRTSKSDRFTIKFKPATENSEETFNILASPADDLQVTLDVSRPSSIAGFKIGSGPKGGHTYFGSDKENPEGYVFHKFWPRTKCTGHVIYKGQAITANGNGMYVHAIQGMRPNLVAARWNFATFESPEHGGVSALMMEFTSTPDFGKHGKGSGGVIVNVGGIAVGGKLVTVTAETRWPGEEPAADAVVQSRALHHEVKADPDTGYKPPTRLTFHWKGPSVAADVPGTVEASINLPVGDPQSSVGLIEKVDVLAEIPKVLKTVIAYAAGTKPYIYTWLNPTTLSLKMGSGEEVEVQGVVFNEATFISKLDDE
ncbi:putative cell survival pathways protein [Tulasnella sp. 403]|nr:putative cell survival pathways protein [Tulasnella sp. 403]